MLDHVARDHEIKLSNVEITINRRVNNLSIRTSLSRDPDAASRCINSCDCVTKCRKPAADVTVSATEIADRPHAVEFLHELDKHIRQLLARRAIARRFGLPFEFGVS